MLSGGLLGWLMAFIVEKVLGRAVDKAVSGEHVEPDESDWDWSKSEDASPDLNQISAEILEADASLFFGEIVPHIERGFDIPQIGLLLNQISRLADGEYRISEFHVRAFGRGTALNVGVQRLSKERIGVLIESDSAVTFEAATSVAKYEAKI